MKRIFCLATIFLSIFLLTNVECETVCNNKQQSNLNLCEECIEGIEGCFEEAIFDINFDKCLKEKLNSAENKYDASLYAWQILMIRAKICYSLLEYQNEQDIPEKHKKLEYIDNLCNALQIGYSLENVTEEGIIKALINNVQCNAILICPYCGDEYENALNHYENLKLDEAEMALRNGLKQYHDYYCSDSLKKDIFYLLYKIYSEKACLLDTNCEVPEREIKVSDFCKDREVFESRVCENCLEGKSANFETSIFYSNSIECMKNMIQNTEDDEVKNEIYDYLYQVYILNSEITFKFASEFSPDVPRTGNSLLSDVSINYNMENAKEIEIRNALTDNSGWNIYPLTSEYDDAFNKYTEFMESKDPTLLDKAEINLRRALKICPDSKLGNLYLLLHSIYHQKALLIFEEVASIKQIREYYQEKEEFERLFVRWISKKYRIGRTAWISLTNTPDRYHWVSDRFAFESDETIEHAIKAVENFTEANARNFYIYLVKVSKTLK